VGARSLQGIQAIEIQGIRISTKVKSVEVKRVSACRTERTLAVCALNSVLVDV